MSEDFRINTGDGIGKFEITYDSVESEKQRAKKRFSGRLLRMIEPIQGGGVNLYSAELRTEDYIETPVLLACERLMEKGIKTILSGANKNNVALISPPHIIIDAKSLSAKNLDILKNVGEMSKDSAGVADAWGILTCETAEDVTEGEIEERMMRIVAQFDDQ